MHGGWADSLGWNSEITALERLGYPVLAPANPLRGLALDAAYIRSILQTIHGPIVLVGHSYGGAVITNAAVGVPQVKAIVYIATFAADKGESLLHLVTMHPCSEIGQNVITRPYPLPGGGKGTDLYLTEHGFEAAFASDLPKSVADQLWAEQRPFSQAAFAAKSGAPAWKTSPSWYLVTTHDHAIPPATQRFIAARARDGLPGGGLACTDDLPTRRDAAGYPRRRAERRLTHPGDGRQDAPTPCRPSRRWSRRSLCQGARVKADSGSTLYCAVTPSG